MNLASIKKMISPFKMLLPKEMVEILDSGLLDRFPEMVGGSLQPGEMYATFATTDRKSFKVFRCTWIAQPDNKILITPVAEVTLESIADIKGSFSEADQKLLNQINPGTDVKK